MNGIKIYISTYGYVGKGTCINQIMERKRDRQTKTERINKLWKKVFKNDQLFKFQ